ncbi:MAG: tail fiber domain-containing protein, partial [Phycisphaerales bacterium]
MGPAGPQGATGLTGAPGPQGDIGPAGPQGETGPAGPQGATGLTGAQGPQGEMGPMGPQGAMGAQGATGLTGAQGPQGDVGPAGPQGETGPAGPQGLQGEMGPAGPQGLQGETGPMGLQGPVGAQGPLGPSGPMGPSGPVGPQGAMGAQGPSGPSGPMGPTGPQGPQGPQGEVGPAGQNNVNWQGAWNNATTYALNDATIYQGSSYRSLVAGNLNIQPDLNPAYWQQFAAAGGTSGGSITWGSSITGAANGTVGFQFFNTGSSSSAAARTVGAAGFGGAGVSGTLPNNTTIPTGAGVASNFKMGLLGTASGGAHVGVMGQVGSGGAIGVWGHNASNGAGNWNAGVVGTTLGTDSFSTGVFGQGNRGVSGFSGLDTNGSAGSGRVLSGGVYGETTNADGSSGYFLGRVTIDNTSANGADTSTQDGLIIWTNSGASGFNSSGALFTPSDRNAKKDFTPVDGRRVLDTLVAMPVTTWHYKNDDKTLYMGPMAQDFFAGFGLGDRDTVIHGVNADGVALAAIKGLNEKLEGELKQRDLLLSAQSAELSDLKTRVQQLELIARQGGFSLGQSAGLGLAIGLPIVGAMFIRRRSAKA